MGEFVLFVINLIMTSFFQKVESGVKVDLIVIRLSQTVIIMHAVVDNSLSGVIQLKQRLAIDDFVSKPAVYYVVVLNDNLQILVYEAQVDGCNVYLELFRVVWL